MTNADWWARVAEARTRREDPRPHRMWALRKGEHAAAIDLKAVPGIGAEIVLTVDGEWRKMRLFRSHEQAERAGAIADTRTMFEGKGMGVNDLTHTTRAVLASLEQQRVRPATRDPWSYDRHDPATRAAEREGINHLRAVVRTLALSHGQRLHCHSPWPRAITHCGTLWKLRTGRHDRTRRHRGNRRASALSCATRGTKQRFVRRIFTDGAELLRDAETERFDLGS
jgi:hypothetical protein